MSVVVIEPPYPIVDLRDIAGTHSLDDATADALLSAAQEAIDGPTGWVGRCFGPQTLEQRLECFPADVIVLPCPPLIQIVSIKFDDASGVEQTLEATAWRLWNGCGVATVGASGWPSANGLPGSVRIRYRAGYEDGITGRVPERARQAVILGFRAMLGLVTDGLLRSEQIEGVGTRSYFAADQASGVLRDTSERLLANLRVYS